MQTLYTIRVSMIYALVKVMPLLLLAILFHAMALFVFPAFQYGSILTLLYTCYRYWSYYLIRYELNTDVLLVTEGWLNRRTDTMELSRIRDYVINRPLWMRIFNLMNLTLYTTDNTNREITLQGIPASDLTDTLRDLVRAARLRNKIIDIS
jgi:membrane protein YdbS with pleckstrin-like domain